MNIGSSSAKKPSIIPRHQIDLYLFTISAGGKWWQIPDNSLQISIGVEIVSFPPLHCLSDFRITSHIARASATVRLTPVTP